MLTNIKWLVGLKSEKAILAILLIAVSVLWTTSVYERNKERAAYVLLINEKTAEVIQKQQEVIKATEHEAALLKDLYYKIKQIENDAKDVADETQIITENSLNTNKKIKKILKNEKK